MSERFVEVPGGRLAVHDFGSGPAIVLLHASIVDAWAWEPLTPYLLDAGYRVVAFDRRGSGASLTEDVAFSNRADVIGRPRCARHRPRLPGRQLHRRHGRAGHVHRVPRASRGRW